MMNRVHNKILQSRDRVGSYHSPHILNSASFKDRKMNESLIENVKKRNINSNTGENIERLIIDEMILLHLIDPNLFQIEKSG